MRDDDPCRPPGRPRDKVFSKLAPPRLASSGALKRRHRVPWMGGEDGNGALYGHEGQGGQLVVRREEGSHGP